MTSPVDTLKAVSQELRERKVNHGRDQSLTLVAWADKIDTAIAALSGGEAVAWRVTVVDSAREYHNREEQDCVYLSEEDALDAGDSEHFTITPLYTTPRAAPEGKILVAREHLAHISKVCRAARDLCQPKPMRHPEDDREHNGGLTLHELTVIANCIDAELTAAPGDEGDHIVDANKKVASTGQVPEDLAEFLDWAADELVKRDTRPGNFSAQVAASLQGRATILRAMDKRRATPPSPAKGE